MKELSKKQQHIAKQAPPPDKITGADFKKLRSKSMKEGDHEVSMAQNSLQAIIEAAQELMAKMGTHERNIPGWIQDHITNAENYIEQAAQGFHEIEHHEEEPEQDMSLVSMMQELEDKKKDKIKSKSDLTTRLKNAAINDIPKMQNFDTLEADNFWNMVKTMLDKIQKGSIGTNIGTTVKTFQRSTPKSNL
jgi:hypothetical protein